MAATDIIEPAQYITFRLDRNLIGINILEIREIVPLQKLTKVWQAPLFVRGLINLRGQILTILDMGVLLGLDTGGRPSGSHIIIFKHKNVGFVVDRIGDVIGIEPGQLEPIPANIDPGIQKHMENIIRLEDGSLIVLSAKKILSHAKALQTVSKEYA